LVERRSDACDKDLTVTMVVSDDPNVVEAALAAGRFACGCGSRLAPRGYGRTRRLRGAGGQRRAQRPRRARWTACGTTTVLSNWSLPRRRDMIEVIGAALLTRAHGVGHRPIAKRLGVPEGTVRGWLRRVRRNAEGLRVWATVIAHDCDPMLHPVRPTRTAIGDTVEALGTAASAIKLRLGGDTGGWPTIVTSTHGRLLTTRSL
jgi:transposase-like protein